MKKILLLMILSCIPAFATTWNEEGGSSTRTGMTITSDLLAGTTGINIGSTAQYFNTLYISTIIGAHIVNSTGYMTVDNANTLNGHSDTYFMVNSSGTEIERLNRTKLDASSGTTIAGLINDRLFASSGTTIAGLINDKLSASSGTLIGQHMIDVNNSTGSIVTRLDLIGSATTQLALSTGSLATSLQLTTTAAYLDSVALSTGNLATSLQLASTASYLVSVALSTGNLATALQLATTAAYLDAVGKSTGVITSSIAELKISTLSWINDCLIIVLGSTDPINAASLYKDTVSVELINDSSFTAFSMNTMVAGNMHVVLSSAATIDGTAVNLSTGACILAATKYKSNDLKGWNKAEGGIVFFPKGTWINIYVGDYTATSRNVTIIIYFNRRMWQ